MQYYNIMLVDDEEEVRHAITKKLNWESMGFRMVGSAENGEEALEMAEKCHPDVVMTDIHMPFMDGLTLCRRLKENFKNIKVVIFSGYDEFEYAKEAIKLEVEEYILKPINAQELQQVFERLKSVLDEEISEKRNIEKLKQYYFESLPMMREQFFIGLLDGNISEEKLREYKESYGIEFAFPYYNVAVLRTEATGKEESEAGQEILDSRFRMVSAKQIVEENLKGVLAFYSFLYLDTVVVIAMMNQSREEALFVHTMDQICKIIHKIVGVNTSVGIGQQCTSPMSLERSYEGAKSALEYRILLEPNQAICIQDIEPERGNSFVIDEWTTESVLREIKIGTKEGLQELLEGLTEQLKRSTMSIQQLQFSISELIIEIVRLARIYKLDIEDILGRDYDIYKNISMFDSLDSLKDWLFEICMQLRNLIRRERVDSTKLITDKAKTYIDENYSDCDLSVDTLCGYLNVSAAYFSTIFKKETGMSFVAYLTKVRMEQALHLLNTTEEKTYIISGKVGYIEPNYFSYVFKKQYGISPSKYRTSKLEEHE